MSQHPRFLSMLWASPAGAPSVLSRYTVLNGVLYLFIGVGLYLMPAALLVRLLFL